MLPNVRVPSPKKSICSVSGSIMSMRKKHAMAVRMMDPQLPLLRAACTSLSLAPSFTRITREPRMEKMMPSAEMISGRRMVDMPP